MENRIKVNASETVNETKNIKEQYVSLDEEIENLHKKIDEMKKSVIELTFNQQSLMSDWLAENGVKEGDMVNCTEYIDNTFGHQEIARTGVITLDGEWVRIGEYGYSFKMIMRHGIISISKVSE